MFNINIGIFTYGLEDDIQPRWSWQTPDPILAPFSQYQDPAITDMYLYHRDNNHYELLLPRHSMLAERGNVPTRLLERMKKQLEQEICTESLKEHLENAFEERIFMLNLSLMELVLCCSSHTLGVLRGRK